MQHHYLSDREKEVLHLVAQEYTTPQIAALLNLSSHAIDTHKKHLKNKLNVKNSAGMVRKGFELGLLQIAASSAAQVLLFMFAISLLSISAEAQNEFEIRTDGIIIPRTTTGAVVSPVEGQLIYDISSGVFMYYDGSIWQSIGSDNDGDSGVFERVGTLVRPSEGIDTDDFVFGSDGLPQTGNINDTLFFFDKSRSAFRVGRLEDSDAWSPDSIGRNSVAMGLDTKATGSTSTAFGRSTSASGDSGATAVGWVTEASGDFGSFSSGIFCEASGDFGATAIGRSTVASGDNGAIALGFNTIAAGNRSIAMGQYNDPLVEPGITPLADSPILIVGNGNAITRRNALVIRQNGQVEFANYVFPVIDGNADQVLTTDGNGQLNWNTIVDDWENNNNHLYYNLGNVGLGTVFPDAKLEIVAQSSRANPTLELNEDVSDEFVRMAFSNRTADERWFFTVKPEDTGSAGDADFNFFYTDGNLDVLRLEGDGDAILAGTLMENSDIRLKKEMTPLSDVLSSLSQMNGYRYKWKDRVNTDQQIGLIAQEVQTVYPELVLKDEDGQLSVSYTKMVPILLEAIKEQEGFIKRHEETLKAQQSMIEQLMKRLEEVEE